MRALVLDDNAKAEVDRVVSHAMDHPFFPGKSPIPGDDPRFVAQLSTYRAVFTFTKTEGRTFRHLTISVPRTNMYPHPIAAWHIAEMFGFTGYDFKSQPDKPGETWMIDAKKEENCVLIVQEIA